MTFIRRNASKDKIAVAFPITGRDRLDTTKPLRIRLMQFARCLGVLASLKELCVRYEAEVI